MNLVADRPGLTLTEVSKHTEVPVATAHRLLRTLRDQGMVHVDVGNRYHLGTHCLYLRRASSKMWTFGPRTRTRGVGGR